MHDIVPADIGEWQRLEAAVRAVFAQYGYSEIRVPVVEKTELFSRSIGVATDVVDKEMYTFEDRNGDLLSLRPEGTAGVVRAVLQSGLLYAAPLRLWYQGPMFRRERPQKGRTRQFHQVGAEVFGAPGPDVDAELLLMCRRLWGMLGLDGLTLELNSLGSADERAAYRDTLQAWLLDHAEQLDKDTLERARSNPLRVLDSKDPAVQELLADAPLLDDVLGEESRAHFAGVCAVLDQAGQAYTLNPRLVRGLDYYSHTVFEWTTRELGAQGTVCAGGRYDGLVELLGGKPWPGIGWALGQERVVELMKQAGGSAAAAPHCYMVLAGEEAGRAGLALAERLRDALPALRIECNAAGGSFKAQFKRADRSGARLALVLGEDELARREITIKPMRRDTDQQQVHMDSLAAWLERWLAERT